jgi:hypothetical protein
LRKKIKPKVGRDNIAPTYLRNLNMIADSTIEDMKANEVCGKDTKMTDFRVDPNNPTGILIVIDGAPLYPANHIDVLLKI